jgi:hypothetical protein
MASIIARFPSSLIGKRPTRLPSLLQREPDVQSAEQLSRNSIRTKNDPIAEKL